MSIEIGKPYLWKTQAYGNIAVHVDKLSPNGTVAVLTIDGGEASTPAQKFPELSDGIGFAILADLYKRTTRKSQTRPSGKVITSDSAETPGTVAHSQSRNRTTAIKSKQTPQFTAPGNNNEVSF